MALTSSLGLQCLTRFASSTATSSDPLLAPRRTKEIDLLVSRMLLDSYAEAAPAAVGVGVVRKWLGGGGAEVVA